MLRRERQGLIHDANEVKEKYYGYNYFSEYAFDLNIMKTIDEAAWPPF